MVENGKKSLTAINWIRACHWQWKNRASCETKQTKANSSHEMLLNIRGLDSNPVLTTSPSFKEYYFHGQDTNKKVGFSPFFNPSVHPFSSYNHHQFRVPGPAAASGYSFYRVTV